VAEKIPKNLKKVEAEPMTTQDQTIEAVDAQLRQAKAKFTRAAMACIKGMPTAEKEVAEARERRS
jgi:hypothetical protein